MKPDQQEVLQKICTRERCPLDLVGQVTGNNRIILHDFADASATSIGESSAASNGESSVTKQHPVNLDLDWVLGKMPSKVFNLTKIVRDSKPFCVNSKSQSIKEMLAMVLRLPSVASKRYLTNKVDRSVTGLIAQQQCVGPLHTPLANVAVTAHSYFGIVGSAVAVGEQPMKTLLSPKVGARMSVGEALTNLVSAPITELRV